MKYNKTDFTDSVKNKYSIRKSRERRITTMFDIKEVSNVEATGSLLGSVISCAGTWGGVYLLYLAACC